MRRPGGCPAEVGYAAGVPRRIALGLVGLVLFAVPTATALASAPSISGGTYAPSEKWVKNHSSASVDLYVADHGTELRAKGTGFSCFNNGNAPLQEYSDILFTVLLPHNLKISSSGHFSYTGDVKVSAYEDQTPYPITTHFSVSGQFTRGKIKPLKTIAVRGTVTSDYCTAKTPTAFKLIYDKG
jgi:hypothetical protein